MFSSIYTWRQRRLLGFIAATWLLLGAVAYEKIGQLWFVGGLASGTSVLSSDLSTAVVAQPQMLALKGTDLIGFKPYLLMNQSMPGIGQNGGILPSLANMPAGMTLLIAAGILGILAAMCGSAILSGFSLFAAQMSSSQTATAISVIQRSWLPGQSMSSTGISTSFQSVVSICLATSFVALVITGAIKGRALASKAAHALEDAKLEVGKGKLSASAGGWSLKR